MRNDLFKYGLYFIVLILIQVLVLNNIQISGFINPYCYILFILILPFETPGWLLLILAFFLGMIIDVFPQGWLGNGTALGFHMAASLAVAFVRPLILKWINPRDEYEVGSKPSASDQGFSWYILYVSIMIGLHHFVLFFLEEFSFSRIPETFLRFLLSSVFTILLLLIWEGFRYQRK